MWLRIYNRKDHTLVATSYDNIGSVYRSLGDCEKALEYHKQGLDMRQRLFVRSGGKDFNTSSIAISYDNVGTVYDSLGDYRQAFEYYKKGRNMWLKIFGDSDHIDVATSY
jgi:tetratricopeptide (TPR) repeat protein